MIFISSIILAFLFVMNVPVMAQSEDSATNPQPGNLAVPVPTPVPSRSADSALRVAYADTYRVLSDPGACSDFYGGPAIAITVLNEFFINLKKEKLPDYIAFSMRGKSTNVFNLPSHASFRLFEKTVVNTEGSFYQRRNSSYGHRIPNIGPFFPATRAARALGFLHELGHLIRSPVGQWLLPDDGSDAEKSVQNTETVRKICNGALKNLN